jgi:hypothetical protein
VERKVEAMGTAKTNLRLLMKLRDVKLMETAHNGNENAKLSLCLTKHEAMKTYGAVEE